MSLKKNILTMFSANFLSLISGILISFIVPAILSVEAYSNVKTYTFYTTFIGLLHFGFIDGMYIKYGGKDPDKIDKREIKAEHNFFVIFQVVISSIIIIFSILSKDIIIFLMAISIIPVNFSSFHGMFHQATGQFKRYSKNSYIYTLIYFTLNILLALILRTQNYIFYCFTTLMANLVIFLLVEIQFYKEVKNVKAKFNKSILRNIKIGFYIMLGNLSVLLFYAIDRIFVKVFLSVSDFAYYSFALSMLNIINVVVSAISVTFFNYLSKGEDEKKIIKIKKYLLILGAAASLGYFVFSAIVTTFINKYIASLSIISISFASYPYIIVINALYVNIYKTRKEEKKYFLTVALMIAISIIYNVIALSLFKTSQSIAFATTLSFITWYFYSMKEFKYLKVEFNELLYLIIILFGFLILSAKCNWFMGFAFYLILVVTSTYIFFKKEVKEVFNMVNRQLS